MTHSAQERVRETARRADLAESRAAQVSEQARAIRDAPVTIQIDELGNDTYWWTVELPGQVRVGNKTFTISRDVR